MANEKLKEAVHFVVESCDDSSKLGAVRLNKILWFADRHSYRETGSTITGDTYVKRRFGPVPKHIMAASAELSDEQKLVIREAPYTTRKTFREFISATPPESKHLSESDRGVLNAYRDLICNNFTASEISDLSHDQVWEAAQEGEEIPFYTVFSAFPGSISADVRDWANKRILEMA